MFHRARNRALHRSGSDSHHALSKARYSSPSEVKVENLTNDSLIPASACCPPFPSEFTRASNPLPQNCHVKKPSLISYDRVRQGSQPDQIAESVLREAQVCELLRQHPHPNLAAYLGCQVSDEGRITGLCFAGYQRTLMQEVNPGGLMKAENETPERQGLQSRTGRRRERNQASPRLGIGPQRHQPQ
jgi:hypothetical protein